VSAAKRVRLFFGVVGVLAVLAGFALPSGAGLLGTGAAKYCDPFSFKVFQPWGDGSNYALMPGGSFEDGTPGWSLSGGAKTIAGNESFYLNTKYDKKSLYMPSGSTATSPTMCFAAGDWHLRFVNKGSGQVRVTVHVNSLLGLLTVLDGGTVKPGATWAPSPKVGLLLTNVTGLLTTKAISIRLTASGGTAQVDDAYLDPWKDT
jgi:hypothetical protein